MSLHSKIELLKGTEPSTNPIAEVYVHPNLSAFGFNEKKWQFLPVPHPLTPFHCKWTLTKEQLPSNTLKKNRIQGCSARNQARVLCLLKSQEQHVRRKERPNEESQRKRGQDDGSGLIGYTAKLLTSSNALFAKSSDSEWSLFNFY